MFMYKGSVSTTGVTRSQPITHTSHGHRHKQRGYYMDWMVARTDVRAQLKAVSMRSSVSIRPLPLQSQTSSRL